MEAATLLLLFISEKGVHLHQPVHILFLSFLILEENPALS
jgi:hypothetical protein